MARLLACLLLVACADKGDDSGVGDGGSAADGGAEDGGSGDGGSDGGSAERWVGTANVRVTDPDGAPVAGVYVMQGGAPESAWVLTDADGMASIDVTDDGLTDRWLLAGAEGWITGGDDLSETRPPDDPFEIEISPLPAADNPAYAFQPGGNAHSMDSSECGHCHNTIADGWVASGHAGSASNSHTWDVYTGAASTVSAADCESLGGWMADGSVPGGDGATAESCYTGEGVLPLLNDGCGADGQPACDHPDEQPSLAAFGSCGDCHAPAVDGGVPGAIDLSAAAGIAFDEGVTCDLCHKVYQVTPGGAPGLDGAIELRRPSEPTIVSGQEFDPINFGPYADVVVPIMKGSYAPQMRESDWCSSCHEYARGPLSDDLPVDGDRWPDGLPLHETWSEWVAGPFAGLGSTCQSCHMPVLDEESSTYDISAKGLVPAMDQGWLRESGDVRHHSWPGVGEMDPPELKLSADWTEDGVDVEVTVWNRNAGHAVPTGEPLRQYVVLVEATDGDGAPAAATGGPTVPDVGGYRSTGTLGVDATLVGATLTVAVPSGAPVAARFVRATGGWADDDGPGTGSFDGLPDEDKGLPLYELVDEVAVLSVAGGTVTLAEAPSAQDGDIVFVVADGDHAGAAGWLYAKTLLGADGERGVAHYQAVDLASDNRIASGARAKTTYHFEALDGEVSARLVFRPYAAPVADRYGWDRGDLEIGTASETSR